MIKISKKRQGFTLIELLVAIALFSIAISIAVGGFVRALRTQRQLVALIAANSNASLAIEEMAREMRTGRNFSCVGGQSPCAELAFLNANEENVDYRLSEDEKGNGFLERGIGSNFERVTAENVDVHFLSFGLFGDPAYPPRITISMAVGGANPDLRGNYTNIETTISSRDF